MIESNFNEEYFRVSNTLDSNDQEIFIDDENIVIYTHPFFKNGEIITDFKIILENNIQPQNVNLVLDSIALLSTNPNVNNYLPLKIELGTKQQIQFADATLSTLTRYKVIAPRVEFPQITNHRFTYQCDLQLQNSGPTNFIGNLGQDDENIYFHYLDTGTSVGQVVIYPSGVQTDNSFNYIVSNNNVCMGIIQNGVNVEVYNLKEDIPDPNLLFTNNENFINAFLPENFCTFVLLTTTPGVLPTLNLTARYWTYNPEDTDLYLSFEFTNENLVLNPNVYVALRNTNNYFVVSIDYPFTNITFDSIQYNRNGGGNINRLITINNDFRNSTNERIFSIFSGGDISNLQVHLFTRIAGGTRINWYYIDFNQDEPKIILNAFSNLINVVDNVILKKYLNIVYFATNQNIYFYNLSNLTSIRFNTIERTPIVPRSLTSILINNRNLLVGGTSNSDAFENNGIISQFNNERNVNDIFKLAYNFDEYSFPYEITSNRFKFKIDLPNNDNISKAEIIQYIIDFRIRYTKERQDKVKLSKSKKNQETPELETKKILGIPGPDFTVNDFLNIYGTI